MAVSGSTLFICSCERTMPLALAIAGESIGARVVEGYQFCGSELTECARRSARTATL